MAGREEADDLATLSRLDEATLVEELRMRYDRDRIYTYVGDILIAINPFKSLPIYSREHLHLYHNVPRTHHPPHVYAIADSAYQDMVTSGNNQCCVISGESGAGKTETCKFLVAELVELSHSKSLLEQRILQVNPLLEAFGNATTSLNSNSSRFGKYLQLKFKDGQVTGAKINEYLLEKSRVVHQNHREQNFHIFYCLLAGLEEGELSRLKLTDPDCFNYLSEGAGCLHTHAQEKRQQFEDVQNALDLVGFETEFQGLIFTCLSAVLHMGNIKFYQDDNEFSHVVDPSGALETVAGLVGIEPQMLEDTCTVSVVVTRGECIRKHLTIEKAMAARDALAKALYDRVFRWIVNRINQLLAPTAVETIGETEIGILDIFGFEKFVHNSFEQLCINVANEQLQFFFNEHIFTLEMMEYEEEGISTEGVEFRDNKPLLDLFLDKPLGLLSMLDEQSSFPKATDKTFLTKVNQAFSNHPHFIKSKGTVAGTFSILHFAGQVEYRSGGFLEKNRDGLPSGAVELLRTSHNELIKLIFHATLTRTGTLALGRLTSRRTGKLRKKKSLGQRHSGQATPTAKTLTVGAQFKNSLQVLIEKMNVATPHFIRCIKPNAERVRNKFDVECVRQQLRYTGMLETIRIRREGFACRLKFSEFIERYETIAASPGMSVSSANCHEILQCAKLTGYQVGRTKVFLKYWHVDHLNELLERVHRAATVLQKLVRGFVQRRKFEVLLSLKWDHDQRVARFLQQLSNDGDMAYIQQKVINKQDEARPKVELAKAPQVGPSLRVPAIPPPSDVSSPPPLLQAEGDSEEEDEGDNFDEDGDHFVAPARNTRFLKFGTEGTRMASVRWFRETQASRLVKKGGNFSKWFHGIITRRQAEMFLMNKPNGTFLIRVSESRFGYSLSFRVADRCKHLMISQVASGKYVIVGQPRVHSDLQGLVKYHTTHPMDADGNQLSIPCGQVPGQVDYGELLEEDDSNFIPIEQPLPIPPRKTSLSEHPHSQLQLKSGGQGKGLSQLSTHHETPPPLPPH